MRDWLRVGKIALILGARSASIGAILPTLHGPQNLRIHHIDRLARRVGCDLIEDIGELHFVFLARDVADVRGTHDLLHFKERMIGIEHDEANSQREDRWFTLGYDASGRLLALAHTYEISGHGNVQVRIVSARKATRRERHSYEEEPR